MITQGNALGSTAAPAGAEPQALARPRRIIHVAVVIVSYRSAAYTIACLGSLQAERGQPALRITAVVVDNASGDFAEIARAVEQNNWSSWVTLVNSPRNGGFAYGNNLGIEHVFAAGTPAYILLLNPDTEVRAGAVAALTEFLEVHPEAGIAGPSFETADGRDWKIAFRFPTLLGEIEQGLKLSLATRVLRRWAVVKDMGDRSEAVDWVSGSSMMIRPEVFAAVGGMDENYFLFFEETDLCRRARRAGFTTWYVAHSRVMHVGGETTNIRKRRPPYWFESRRRYFAVTYGVAHAMLADIAAVAAHALGSLKRLIQGRPGTPSFIRDLIHHSVIWSRNRHVPPALYRTLSVPAAERTNAEKAQPRT